MTEQELLGLEPHRIDPSLGNKKYTFCGGPGTRKTSVAMKFPSPFLMATERGYAFIDGVIKQDILTWGNALETINLLVSSDPLKEKFETVVIDRADTLYTMCKDSTCSSLGIKDPGDLGFGKGWAAVKKAFNRPISRLERAGYGIVFIIHDKDLMDNNMKRVGYAHDLEKNARATILGLSDFVFHLRPELIDEGDLSKGRTVYAYNQTIDIDTKSRARYLNPKFEFTYDSLEREVTTAIEKQVKLEGIETQVKGRVELQPESFESLKAKVIELTREVLSRDMPDKDLLTRLIQEQLRGKKIGEVTDAYYEPLLVLKEYLLSIV